MRGACIFLAALFLAGCDLPERALRSVTGDPPVASISREQGELANLLADAKTPKMVLRIPNFQFAVTMLLAGQRAGVDRWRTTDNAQIYTKDGLVIGTRGFGHDIMSVDFGQAAALIAGERSGQITRIHRLLTGDDQIALKSWVCDITPLGVEQLQISEKTWIATRVVTETCFGPSGGFENRYWVGAGVLRQSQQYIGPDIGMIQLLFL